VPTDLINFNGSNCQRLSASDLADICLLTLISVVPCLGSLFLAMQFSTIARLITTLG